MEFLDLKSQYELHKENIDKAIKKILGHGKFVLGPETYELEKTLSDYVNTKFCLTVTNGTLALLIALMALGVSNDDEVITTPFTWISTAEVVALLGAKPVFVDINPKTFNLDSNLIAQKITKKTKVILPVSLFGQICELEEINAIAKKFNLKVIEDAAQSFGAIKNNKKSCSFTDIATTSFYPAKPLGCYGEGGAIFTNSKELYDKMFAIRNHGGKVRDFHDYVGINGRMDTLQAAILLEKLKFFDDELKKRNLKAQRYDEELKDFVTIPYKELNIFHSYAQYTIRCKKRDLLKDELEKQDIPAAIFYPRSLHQQKVFNYLGYKKGDFPNSEKANQEVLSLPVHPYLLKEDQDKVITAIKRILKS
jgi:UDP-2-acetamido-2-deoxy-ribo-hexuluronate aminotransferase